MNPKDEVFFSSQRIKQFTEKEENDENEDVYEIDSYTKHKLENLFFHPNTEIKEFTQNVIETSVFDTNFLSSIQTKEDWIYLKNKLNDKTLEITLSDPLEFWNCTKYYLQLFDQLTEQKQNEEYHNDDNFLKYFDDIKSIKNSVLILLKRFVPQMGEEIILEIINYCKNHNSNQKEISSLLLATFEYETIPSEIVIENAFILEGKYFLKAILLIHERFPHVPLNSINFYKRIIEINDKLTFQVLDCGCFSDHDLTQYGVIDYAFSQLDYYNSNNCNADKISTETFIYETTKFLSLLFKRTQLINKYYLTFVEKAKSYSVFSKLQIIKLFDFLLEDLDNELYINLIQHGFINLLVELLEINYEKEYLFVILKMLHFFIDICKSNDIDIHSTFDCSFDDMKDSLENIQEQYLAEEEICEIITSLFEQMEIE